ncbi:hypothetical protein CYMTET_19910 [Cymbomonas tetramitiformis]|uniref:Uncharacterized protein n=1 Tax=Cymbomonas tetramitiformis TaxID=36881 RepID=A0AAE0G525_9CHLO|nr:hypothetical protein CYMTET_19910 [Cymbomonas tetramitiformis]
MVNDTSAHRLESGAAKIVGIGEYMVQRAPPHWQTEATKALSTEHLGEGEHLVPLLPRAGVLLPRTGIEGGASWYFIATERVTDWTTIPGSRIREGLRLAGQADLVPFFAGVVNGQTAADTENFKKLKDTILELKKTCETGFANTGKEKSRRKAAATRTRRKDDSEVEMEVEEEDGEGDEGYQRWLRERRDKRKKYKWEDDPVNTGRKIAGTKLPDGAKSPIYLPET